MSKPEPIVIRKFSPHASPFFEAHHQPPPTTAVSDKPGSINFFRLPRELRNIVYTMAYGERRVFKIKSRKAFEKHESGRRRVQGDSYVPATFPESSVGHLLINKNFFVEAAEIWTACKVFECRWAHDFFKCLGGIRSMSRQVLQHVTEVSFNSELGQSEVPKLMLRMRKLTRVTVKLDDIDIPGCGEMSAKVTWLLDYSDAELANAGDISPLLLFRGLKSLTVNWDDDPRISSLEGRNQMAKTKAQVQTLLDDVVTRAPEKPFKRKSIPEFSDALRAATAKTSQRLLSVAPTSMATGPVPLLDHEIPETKDEMLRLMLLRPEAVHRWMLEKAGKVVA